MISLNNITKPKEYFDSLLLLFNSIHFDKPCVYLSSPITTGMKYYEWKKENIENVFGTEEHYSNVIVHNILFAKSYINVLKNKNVICPTIFEEHIRNTNLNWKEDDFYLFWQMVLEKIQTIYFVPDWQYSTGCCYEYYISHLNNIKSYEFTHKLNEKPFILTPQMAYEKIKNNGLNNNRVMQDVVNYLENYQ